MLNHARYARMSSRNGKKKTAKKKQAGNTGFNLNNLWVHGIDELSALFKRRKNRHILPPFLRKMKKLNVGSLTGGNLLSILTDGDTCFNEFIEAIRSASVSINLETYIFNSDNTGWEIARLLAEKAKNGLEVNLIYDSAGCMGTSPSLFSYMRKEGVEVIEYNPVRPWRRISKMSLRDHRKILVVDGSTAFIGGNNIGDEYAGSRYNGGNWRDTHLKIQGPAVRDIQYIFMENWYRNGGAMLQLHRHFGTIDTAGDTIVMVLGSKARKNSVRPIMESYISAIDNSHSSIHITNAYFVPNAKLYRSLIRAVERGVEVSVMVPGRSDIKFVEYASHYLYKRYLKKGIRLFEYVPSMLHAKTAVIDGIWSTIGSSNLDGVTLMRNLEINAVVLDQDFGRNMQKIFRNDLENCREVLLDDWEKRSPAHFVAEWFCYHTLMLL